MTQVAKEETQKEKRRRYMKRWREENREHVRDYNRSWTEGNKARKAYMTDYNRKRWADSDLQQAERERKRICNYQMSPEEFNARWVEQGGKCQICERQMEPRGRKSKSAVVDHNHATGEVRGILCRTCNSGLGSFRDDPENLQRAADYLAANGHYAELKRIK